MDNISLLFNNTSEEDLLGEFPYWKAALAINFVVDIGMTGCVVAIHLVLLVVLLKNKKEHLKPLNLIHISLLATYITAYIFRIFLDILYLPSYYRYCVCSRLISTIYLSGLVIFNIFPPFAIASLGVLKLLVILGKKKFVTLKVASGMIAACYGITLIYLAFAARMFYNREERIYCQNTLCPDTNTEARSRAVLMTVSVVSSFVPSLIIVLITSTWSCVVFKQYYTGGNNQLNRRILSLPIIMPLALIASAVLEAVIAQLVLQICLSLSLGVYLPYWIIVFQAIANYPYRVISRLAYPVILVYTHSYIREAVKTLIQQIRGKNRVTPENQTQANFNG